MNVWLSFPAPPRLSFPAPPRHDGKLAKLEPTVVVTAVMLMTN